MSDNWESTRLLAKHIVWINIRTFQSCFKRKKHLIGKNINIQYVKYKTNINKNTNSQPVEKTKLFHSFMWQFFLQSKTQERILQWQDINFYSVISWRRTLKGAMKQQLFSLALSIFCVKSQLFTLHVFVSTIKNTT